ncbi:hypothetical protein FACS1894167_04900 [Synergistales bacterium]|nr:hypothetical protein FACS1894167_04900 [Synergistales bacterium]
MRLTVKLCAAPADINGKPSGHRKALETFAEDAVKHYGLESGEKGEVSAEWKIAGKGEEASDAFLFVGTPKSLLGVFSNKDGNSGDESHYCAAVLPDNQWDEDLNKLLQNPRSNVLAVIRGKNALCGSGGKFREEDVLQLAEILKSLARRYVRARAEDGISEETLSKSIDWKCSIPEKVSGSSSFISFFSDPAMTKMGRELKAALLDLDISTRAKNNGRKWDKVHSILLLGETGTGKSLAAEWIANQLSSPMFPLNMASLPHNMVDLELFGSVPGAYTGADNKPRDGILQAHAEKVIFLDEIGEMELESQARLLKYLDCGEVRRMGDTKTSQHFSIIVAATNRPWDQWVQMENPPFHADLFYRFDHVVKIPSLKERKKDMRLLISLLLQDTSINKKNGGECRVKRISIDAIEYLEDASYPGNFRDIRERIRSALGRAASEGASVLCLRHLIH